MKHEVKPGVRVLWSCPACLKAASVFGTIKAPVKNPDAFFVNWTNGRTTRVAREEVWFTTPGPPPPLMKVGPANTVLSKIGLVFCQEVWVCVY